MNERIILVALVGVGSVLAVASSIARPDAPDGSVAPTAGRLLAGAREGIVEPPRLEACETSAPEGRLSVPDEIRSSRREVVRRSTLFHRAPTPRPFPTDPVEVRSLPETTWKELTFKRDAIETLVNQAPKTAEANPEILAWKDEVKRLNPAIQDRAIAEYWERKAQLASSW